MNFKTEARWLVLIALVTIAVYTNSLGGKFVYDDKRQVVMNSLIQEPSLYGKALSNDVWAFKGDGTISTSNYWRPTFTAWCIVNFRLFGLEPFGWHVLDLMLQLIVCLLAYVLLRRWDISPIAAFCIVLIFAVHPIHSETVAWLAGSPDLLFGASFLASLWFAESAADPKLRKRRLLNLSLAIGFYVLALGAKEVALVCFPVYYLIFSRDASEGAKKNKTSAVGDGLVPFALTAAVFFIVRWMILGQLSRPAQGAASLFSALLSAPSVFVFYLRQLVFPVWVAVNYPLRPVENVGILNFALPLIISVIAAILIWKLAVRSHVQKIGLAMFILPLLPVFNLPAFQPEQIVHDRYLYLPLLGFLMIVIPFLRDQSLRYFGEKAERYLMIFAIAVSVPLAVQTFVSNTYWHDELSLWRHALSVDSASATNWSALAAELSAQEKYEDAIKAYDSSIAIRPGPNALTGRAQSLIRTGKYDDAIRDLNVVISTDPNDIDLYTLYQAYEGLAVAYQQKNELKNAEAALLAARQKMPIYRAALTEKLAVVLYLEDRKQDALSELEGMRTQARAEMLPASKSVFLRLGMLYSEMGRKDDARKSLQEYLQLTKTTWDKETPEERQAATEMLKSLK